MSQGRSPPKGNDRHHCTPRPMNQFHPYGRINRSVAGQHGENLYLYGQENIDILKALSPPKEPEQHVFAPFLPKEFASSASDLLPQYVTKINAHLAGELEQDPAPVSVPTQIQVGSINNAWKQFVDLTSSTSAGLIKKERVAHWAGVILQFVLHSLQANLTPCDPWLGVQFDGPKNWVVRSSSSGAIRYYDPWGNSVLMPIPGHADFTRVSFPHLTKDSRFPAQIVGVSPPGFGSLPNAGSAAVSGSASSSSSSSNAVDQAPFPACGLRGPSVEQCAGLASLNNLQGQHVYQYHQDNVSLAGNPGSAPSAGGAAAPTTASSNNNSFIQSSTVPAPLGAVVQETALDRLSARPGPGFLQAQQYLHFHAAAANVDEDPGLGNMSEMSVIPSAQPDR
eukprot:g13244.t1